MREIPIIGGGTINLRPLTSADEPALSVGAAELSSHSVYLRYHSPRSAQLTSAELAYLTNVDQWHRAAWVLLDGCKGIAVGRYFRLIDTPHMAEVSLAILDPWQGRGLSKLMLAALINTAQLAGIRYFVGTVLNENVAVLRISTSLGAGSTWLAEEGVWQITLDTNTNHLPKTAAADAIRYYQKILSNREGFRRTSI